MLPLTRSVWVCLYYRCLFAAFSFFLLMRRWKFSNDDENYFFVFSEWLKYCDFEKSVYNVQNVYLRKWLYEKKVILSISNFNFYFLKEYFMLTKNALDVCLFSILSIFLVGNDQKNSWAWLWKWAWPWAWSWAWTRTFKGFTFIRTNFYSNK